MSLLAVAVQGRGVVDPQEPLLHVDDQALLRGRGVFETVRVYGGRPFKLGPHVARMAESAARLDLPLPTAAEIEETVVQALAAAATPDAVLRLFATPGREGDARGHLFALVSALPTHFDELRARGLRMISLILGPEAAVRISAPWLLGGVKSTSYAVNMSAEKEAKARGGDDAVFTTADHIVLEGPVTNVWWRTGGTLYTPSLELGILAGVTRATVIELAPAAGFEVVEGRFTLAELAAADEAFTSSSIREIVPIVQLDGQPLGDGRPGEGARALQAALRRAAGA